MMDLLDIALSDFFDNRTIYSSASNLCRDTPPRFNEWVRNAVACRDCLLFLASWRQHSHHVALCAWLIAIKEHRLPVRTKSPIHFRAAYQLTELAVVNFVRAAILIALYFARRLKFTSQLINCKSLDSCQRTQLHAVPMLVRTVVRDLFPMYFQYRNLGMLLRMENARNILQISRATTITWNCENPSQDIDTRYDLSDLDIHI